MIPDHVRTEILRRIRSAEREHNVRVLLAIESGSRAWGFESPNSDYDARFIYANTPDWYLAVNLEDKRDVIEYPIVDDIDLNGWDVRKALKLFARSNPTFVEWIQSPIIYIDDGVFAQSTRALLPSIYSCISGVHHYRSMAKTNFRGYLTAELVPLKKYFYVLRPLLSVRWLERYRTPAPIEFSKLLHLLEGQDELQLAFDALLAQKRQSPEMGLAPQISTINVFIENELERLEGIQVETSSHSDMDRLNDIFRAAIGYPATAL